MAVDELGGVAFGDIEAMFLATSGGCLKGVPQGEKRVGAVFGRDLLLQLGKGPPGMVAAERIENETLQGDRDRNERENEEGPHEAAAFEKEIFYGKVHERWRYPAAPTTGSKG